MKFSLSWLKEHLETSACVQDIEKALVALGLEVEDVKTQSLDGFVVGLVSSCERHPNADRLSLCMVDDGSGTLQQVVCGAPNVRQGLKIAFARVGCLIPITNEVLKKGKIRDIESLGMICSAKELLLGQDSHGIMELQTEALPGMDLAQALNLNDAIFDISITPNRSDCFSLKGVARDLAAKGVGKFIEHAYKPIEVKSTRSLVIQDKDVIPYFSFVEIKNITNKESPKWLKDKIEAAGQNPISALVDIANFVMYDLGQPLHMFDADHLKGGITVQKVKGVISFKALDENIYALDEDIVVCDEQGIQALAGIKGGFESSSQLTTKNILIEAAIFNPVEITKTGQRLNLFSDARARFERGIDSKGVKRALAKATQLVLEICGGEIVGFTEVGSTDHKSDPIPFTLKFLEEKSGQSFDLIQVHAYLTKLGCQVNGDSVTTPSWRHDLNIPEDLVEEVLRLHGYDNIACESLPIVMPVDYLSSTHQAKRALNNRGMDETYSFSMIPLDTARLFKDDVVVLPAPLNQDLSTLRPSLLPSLIQVALYNKTKSQHYISVFETAPVFTQTSDSPCQQVHLSGLRFNQTHEPHWVQSPRAFDVFDVKSDLLSACKAFNVDEGSVQVEATAPSYYHPKRSGCFKQGKKVLGYFGELHPSVLKKMGVTQACLGFELIIDNMPPIRPKKKAYKPLSPYQMVNRDFAFMMDKSLPYESLVRLVKKIDPKLIRSIQVFDVFDKGDHKSVAIRLKIQADDRTLTDAELLELQNQVIKVASTIGAVIRSGQHA